MLKLGILLRLSDNGCHSAVDEVCRQDWFPKWWLLGFCSLLLVHQLDGPVFCLTSSSILHPTSEDGSCSLVILLLFFHLLETLLQIDDLLRLPVEALLSERLFLLFLLDLDLGPAALGTQLEQMLALVIVLYKKTADESQTQ